MYKVGALRWMCTAYRIIRGRNLCKILYFCVLPFSKNLYPTADINLIGKNSCLIVLSRRVWLYIADCASRHIRTFMIFLFIFFPVILLFHFFLNFLSHSLMYIYGYVNEPVIKGEKCRRAHVSIDDRFISIFSDMTL